MKIAFTSCSKIQNQSVQPAWRAIEEEKPDHLLMLGDNVYSPWWRWSHKKLRKRYVQQFKEQNFRSLIQRVPFNATWDDHDFGPNNKKGAHTSEKKRRKSRALFHRFMNCSTNLPHVYHAFDLGDVRVIMLDVRYYREKPRSRKCATILGSEQEAWLERELQHSKRYTVVCSGSCLVDGTERLESYDDYYPRLLALLRSKGRVVFLSGDIHENKWRDHRGFFEVISSGVGRDGLNNYGTIEFGEDVHVTLKGSREGDNSSFRIDPDSWSVID